MENSLVIQISDLVYQTATRARGKEAYGNLTNRIQTVVERPLTVVIDFTAAPSVTASFIDELVLRSGDISKDVKIVFRLKSEHDLEKLRRVCAIRSVHCSYQLGEKGAIKRTRDTSVPRVEVQEYPGSLFAI